MGTHVSVSPHAAISHSSLSRSQRPLLNKAQNERVNRRLLMSSDDNSVSMEMHDISGYQEAPLLSLEQACNKLHIQNLSNYIAKAKNMSRHSRNGLTQDEQAAIPRGKMQ
ncbi:unnamed protein product, partial [Rotaria magnacalcarata]